MWPIAVVAASSFNASPYQLLATNVGGIGWTIYHCFFSDHGDEHEENSKVEHSSTMNFNSSETL